jgi:hypothetical protein
MRETSVFVLAPGAAFAGGEHEVHFRVTGEDGFDGEYEYRLLGPEHDDDDHDDDRRERRERVSDAAPRTEARR